MYSLNLFVSGFRDRFFMDKIQGRPSPKGGAKELSRVHKITMEVMLMDINSISTSGAYETYAASTAADSKNTKSADSKESAATEKAAVYEKSSKKLSETERKDLVAKLKADSDRHVENLKSLVEKMFLQQGQKFQDATSMWQALANGELEVDEETAAKAKEDISENGYWGVEQTSQRILDFAVALSGGDENKMKDMAEAFKKGFQQATKAWGKDLPDISQQTYDAVLKKFEDYGKEE